jgi:hypothetical protein
MKPMHFVTLAIVALVSTALALSTYAANNTWSPGRVAGARMLPASACAKVTSSSPSKKPKGARGD